MRIKITTAQELGVVMRMASKGRGADLRDLADFTAIKLIFVVEAESQAADVSFDSMIKILDEQGCRLTAEVMLPKKGKKGSGKWRQA